VVLGLFLFVLSNSQIFIFRMLHVPKENTEDLYFLLKWVYLLTFPILRIETENLFLIFLNLFYYCCTGGACDIYQSSYTISYLISLLPSGTGIWNQGLMLARQVLYHLRHPAHPITILTSFHLLWLVRNVNSFLKWPTNQRIKIQSFNL
jgi:hypothetical protein